MNSVIALLVGWVLDLMVGDPARLPHPIVWFGRLIAFGERHIFDVVGYDFFAVSMPELEVYQDDIQQRSDDYCRRLTALGHQGLREIGL